jgi:hypothetical protein
MLKMGTINAESGKNADVTDEDKGFCDPMAVTWMNKYSSTLDKIWTNLPKNFRPIIVTLAVFTFGATIRGKFFPYFINKSKVNVKTCLLKETSKYATNKSCQYIHYNS